MSNQPEEIQDTSINEEVYKQGILPIDEKVHKESGNLNNVNEDVHDELSQS